MIVKLREGLFPALISAVSHLIRVGELELPAVAGPRYELLARLVGQQLQQELPQLDRARALETATTLVFIGYILLNCS